MYFSPPDTYVSVQRENHVYFYTVGMTERSALRGRQRKARKQEKTRNEMKRKEKKRTYIHLKEKERKEKEKEEKKKERKKKQDPVSTYEVYISTPT